MWNEAPMVSAGGSLHASGSKIGFIGICIIDYIVILTSGSLEDNGHTRIIPLPDSNTEKIHTSLLPGVDEI